MVRSSDTNNTDLTKYADASKIVEQLPLDKDFRSEFNNVRQGGGKKRKLSKKQKGSGQGNIGYILNVEKPRIGGLAEVNGYQTQPEYVDGKVSTVEDLCGGARVNLLRSDRGRAKVGGMRKKSRKNKISMKKRNLRRKTKKSKGNSRRVNKNKKSRRNSKKMRSQGKINKIRKMRRMKKGGSWLEKCHTVQGDGQQGVFHDNMVNRTFDCKQPNWDPKCT